MAKKNPIKIAIVGPESCGKSTLALALAQHYSFAYVPEVAREYFLTHTHTNYSVDDVIMIAQLQQERENLLAQQYGNLICDTSALVNRIWAEVRFGYCPAQIRQLESSSSYVHTLLCAPDLPWQADPLRENPHDRENLFNLYVQHLSVKSAPFSIVSGIGATRLNNALSAIKYVCI